MVENLFQIFLFLRTLLLFKLKRSYFPFQNRLAKILLTLTCFQILRRNYFLIHFPPRIGLQTYDSSIGLVKPDLNIYALEADILLYQPKVL